VPQTAQAYLLPRTGIAASFVDDIVVSTVVALAATEVAPWSFGADFIMYQVHVTVTSGADAVKHVSDDQL
jgi:hypothetical protein